VATACSSPPEGRAPWTLELLVLVRKVQSTRWVAYYHEGDSKNFLGLPGTDRYLRPTNGHVVDIGRPLFCPEAVTPRSLNSRHRLGLMAR